MYYYEELYASIQKFRRNKQFKKQFVQLKTQSSELFSLGLHGTSQPHSILLKQAWVMIALY